MDAQTHQRTRRSGPVLRAAAVFLVLCVVATACSQSQAELAQAALQSGIRAHQQGKLDQAETLYREALKHDGSNISAIYNLGLVEQTRGRDDKAVTWYLLAIALDQNYAPALFNLAVIRTNKGDLKDAISLYRRYNAQRPKAFDGHLNLGHLLIKIGQKAAGEAEIRLAARLKPSLLNNGPHPTQTATPSTGPQSSS